MILVNNSAPPVSRWFSACQKGGGVCNSRTEAVVVTEPMISLAPPPTVKTLSALHLSLKRALCMHTALQWGEKKKEITPSLTWYSRQESVDATALPDLRRWKHPVWFSHHNCCDPTLYRQSVFVLGSSQKTCSQSGDMFTKKECNYHNMFFLTQSEEFIFIYGKFRM